MVIPEGWQAVPDFPRYAISEAGDVWSEHQSRLLAQTPDGDGYLTVKLWRSGRQYIRRVHCLVAQVYLGPRPEGLEVCHFDGDLVHNHVSNLRYDTSSANKDDTVRNGNHVDANKTHCIHRHELTGENVYIERRANGRQSRKCRKCRRQWAKKAA